LPPRRERNAGAPPLVPTGTAGPTVILRRGSVIASRPCVSVAGNPGACHGISPFWL
jgi:hypothetical protein